MRRLGGWGLGLVLLAGLSGTVAVAADQDDAGTPAVKSHKSGWNWFGSWFGAKKKPADKKSEAKAEKTTLPAVRPSSMADQAEALRSREQAALIRRLEVCDRLREIALQTNDTFLESQALQLEERAGATFARRTAHLPIGSPVEDLDEQILERHTKIGSANGLLPARSPSAAGKQGREGGNAALGVKP
jgi:hypothetical protein